MQVILLPLRFGNLYGTLYIYLYLVLYINHKHHSFNSKFGIHTNIICTLSIDEP